METSDLHQIFFENCKLITLTDGIITGCWNLNPRWRRRPYWISWKRYNSVEYCPKTMEFDTQVHDTRLEWFEAEPDALIQIQDGRRRHLEFYKNLYNSAIYGPILMKFEMWRQQNVYYWKMVKAGYCAYPRWPPPPSWISKKPGITWPFMVRFWWNLKCSIRKTYTM